MTCLLLTIYLDGKKWNGVEKEYDEDSGKLIFECKLTNGERDGEGKECDKFNNEPNYRSIDDNTLRRHLRNLQMYWDIMIRLAKKYQVI